MKYLFAEGQTKQTYFETKKTFTKDKNYLAEKQFQKR